MKNEKVSIIIPMYNSEKTIVQVLSSLEHQTAKEHILKVIVVNDGSTDESEQEVYKYAYNSGLNIELYNKINGGVSSARNLGMLHANGSKWIAFCDSDDLWHTDKLQKQLQVLRDNENIDLIGCAFDDKPLRIGLKRINRLYRGTVKDICIKNFPQPSTVIMKKKIYDEIGGFDEKQKYAEDGNYFLKIAANYNLYYLPEQLIDFGFGKRGFGETGLSSNLKEMYAGNVKNLNEIRDAGYINTLFYMMMRIFFGLKYCRRIFITKVCGKKYEYKS